MRVIFAAVQIGFALCMLATVDRIVSGEATCVAPADVVGSMWVGITVAALLLATAAVLIYRGEP